MQECKPDPGGSFNDARGGSGNIEHALIQMGDWRGWTPAPTREITDASGPTVAMIPVNPIDVAPLVLLTTAG